jgi:hypothetical protein
MKTAPPPDQNARMARAIEDLRDACAELAAKGCQVLRAQALDLARRRPVIEIAPPPLRACIACGRLRISHVETTYAALVGGCQVEWRIVR